MSECHSSDLAFIVDSIQEVAQQLHPGCEDDLEALLTWLNPNESTSNHHMRPPPLRLKDAIKLFVNQYCNSGYITGLDGDTNKGPEFELGSLLRQFYIYQVRIHFFTSFNLIQSFKDIQRLEKYYETPLAYIYLFEANPYEWVIERDGLRHYLLKRNAVFQDNLKQRLESLIMQDDFEYVAETLDWIDKAHTSLSSKDILLDLTIAKIRKFCDDHMAGNYSKTYLVMKTFNKFIIKYWTSFTQLLGCPEDDHRLTNVVYTCFEKQFIRIRTREVFDIFVHEFPGSKPTILEMKKLVTHSIDFKRIVVVFLSVFEKKILNPSITTVDALLAYVKSVKAFLTFDPAGRYLQSVISFVKQTFQERSDLVVILLYAVLDLQLDELVEGSRIQADPNSLKALASELRDPELGIESGAYTEDNPENDATSLADMNIEGCLPYKQVLQHYLSWNPDPSDVLPRELSRKSSPHMSLLDILMELFESKDFFISEFLKLLTKRLLSLKYYSLDGNWAECLQLLKEKFAKGAPNMVIAPSGKQNEKDGGEDYANINSNDVMLWDVRCSYELSKQMHQVTGLDQRVYPKFISYLYWNCQLESHNDFIVPEALNREFEKYCRVYSEVKAGRALKLLKDQGVIELDLEFQDGRVLKCDATLEQYSVIQLFDGNDQVNRLTAETVSSDLNLNVARAKNALQFWVEKGVLHQDDGIYTTQESRQDSEPRNVQSGSAGSVSEKAGIWLEEETALSKALRNVWPFVQGMLTNLGSLKVAKIHSFLKVTVPKEVGYTVVTQSQLETYLNALVDEDKLACTTNGSYKLLQ